MTKTTRRQRQEQVTREIRAVAERRGMDSLTSRQLVALLQETEGMVEWAATSTLIAREKDSIDALLEGLKHASGKIRATCALLLDHVADDRCIEPLLYAIRNDPQEAVRRCAMHSLICDGCKECPLHTDVIAALIEVALTDRSVSVRRRAVFYLSQQRMDARVIPAMQMLLDKEKDAILLRRVQHVLQHHQATFRLQI